MSFVVRPPEAGEQAAWAALRLALWPGLDPVQNEAEMMAGLDDDERYEVLLALSAAGQPWGFVEVTLRPWAEGCTTPPPVGYVEGWYVVPEARGRGVGRALLAAAEDWARARGCLEMASDADLDAAGAITVHGALGYREVGRAVHFLKALPPLPRDGQGEDDEP